MSIPGILDVEVKISKPRERNWRKSENQATPKFEQRKNEEKQRDKAQRCYRHLVNVTLFIADLDIDFKYLDSLNFVKMDV